MSGTTTPSPAEVQAGQQAAASLFARAQALSDTIDSGSSTVAADLTAMNPLIDAVLSLDNQLLSEDVPFTVLSSDNETLFSPVTNPTGYAGETAFAANLKAFNVRDAAPPTGNLTDPISFVQARLGAVSELIPRISNAAPSGTGGGISIIATDADKLANTPPASTPNTIAGSQPSTTTPFTFTATRTGDTTQAGTATWSVAGSGANPVPAGDFQATSGTVNFAAGQASQTLTVNLGPHVTLAKPNDGFTVTVTDAAGHTASANGNVQGVGTPSAAVLADLANAAYTPATANVDGYTQIQGSTAAYNAGLIEPASPNLGGTPNGFFAEALQDGNQVVVAIRGTISSLFEYQQCRPEPPCRCLMEGHYAELHLSTGRRTSSAVPCASKGEIS